MSWSRHRAWFAGNIAIHAVFGVLGSVRGGAWATILSKPPGTGFSASSVAAPWGMSGSGLSAAVHRGSRGRNVLLATIAPAWGLGWLDDGTPPAALSAAA
ncbi:MAG: hypothetical protein ABI247_09890 [Rhodanobacter sp.]